MLNISSYFEEEPPRDTALSPDTYIHPNKPNTSSGASVVSAQLFLLEAADTGWRDSPLGTGTSPQTSHPRGQNTASLAHCSAGMQWHTCCGNGSPPSKPVCDGNQCPVTSWQHNSNRDPQCAEISQSSLRQPSGGPSIKAFDLLLLKGLS